jgi:hypothetical protein
MFTIKSAHIKRPINSFMIWSCEMRQRYMIDKNNLKINKHNAEFSKYLGYEWALLSDDIKLKYKEKAEIIRLNHKLMYPDYKYEPKKNIKKIKKNKNQNIKTLKPRHYTKTRKYNKLNNENIDILDTYIKDQCTDFIGKQNSFIDTNTYNYNYNYIYSYINNDSCNSDNDSCNSDSCNSDSDTNINITIIMDHILADKSNVNFNKELIL